MVVLNTFVSYLLLVIIFLCIIICAFMTGKKLREIKDKKNDIKSENSEAE